jgi:hypothetical protein
LQNGVAVPAQSGSPRHWTHSDVPTLQRRFEAEHCASDVQPALHSKSRLQIGSAAGQSALAKHWTHRPVRTAHRGSAAEHSLFWAHSTHCALTASQMALPRSVQSVFALQPRHWPVAVSQIGASPGQSLFALQAE